MKKITTLFSALLLAASLVTTTPVLAQRDKNDNSSASSRSKDNNDNDNDSGKWGLLGLAGLLGLLGLKRNDDRDRVYRTETTRVRP